MLPDDIREFTAKQPSPRRRRPIPVIDDGEYVGEFDADDLDAALETGAFDLRVSRTHRTFLIFKHRADD